MGVVGEGGIGEEGVGEVGFEVGVGHFHRDRGRDCEM